MTVFKRLWFAVTHSLDIFKGTYVLTTTRNPSSANGLDAAKVLRGNMTASVTSSYIRTTAHSLAKVAGSPLRGLMRSIATVRHYSTTFFKIAVLTECCFSTLGGWLWL